MNQITTDTQNSQKYTPLLRILSLVALICIALSCINYFTVLEYNSSVSFHTPTLQSLLFMHLILAPAVLFFLFSLKRKNMKFLFSFIFACYFFYSAIDLISRGHSIIANALVIIGSVMAFVCTLTGLRSKVLWIISISIGALGQILLFIPFINSLFFYINNSLYLSLFLAFFKHIGTYALYAGLLLFGLNYKRPVAAPRVSEPPRSQLEQKLQTLDDLRSRGMITEEEYQSKRAELISSF